jgi:hypothetical protein
MIFDLKTILNALNIILVLANLFWDLVVDIFVVVPSVFILLKN